MTSAMSLSTSHSSPPPQFSPLEQEVLQEYAKLLTNMNTVRNFGKEARVLMVKVSNLIADMAGQPTTRILDSLRSLERKTGLVFTFFKASVYAMVVCLFWITDGNILDEQTRRR